MFRMSFVMPNSQRRTTLYRDCRIGNRPRISVDRLWYSRLFYLAPEVCFVSDFFLRLKDIYEGIDLVLSEITADECAVEGVFVAENPNTALKLGQARGAALAAVLAHNLPVYEHATRRVKKTVVGTGSATKDQVDYMVKQTLQIEGKLSVDAADALAVAICHARSFSLRDNSFNPSGTTRDFLRS